MGGCACSTEQDAELGTCLVLAGSPWTVSPGALHGITPTVLMSSAGVPSELKAAGICCGGKEKPLVSTQVHFEVFLQAESQGVLVKRLCPALVKPDGKNNIFTKMSSPSALTFPHTLGNSERLLM